MSRPFIVTQAFAVQADSPEEAAEKAFDISKGEAGTSNVFKVIDLLDDTGAVTFVDTNGDETTTL